VTRSAVLYVPEPGRHPGMAIEPGPPSGKALSDRIGQHEMVVIVA
jgi:hypothetical protein